MSEGWVLMEAELAELRNNITKLKDEAISAIDRLMTENDALRAEVDALQKKLAFCEDSHSYDVHVLRAELAVKQEALGTIETESSEGDGRIAFIYDVAREALDTSAAVEVFERWCAMERVVAESNPLAWDERWGTWLAQMPVEVARAIVGMRKRLQDALDER